MSKNDNPQKAETGLKGEYIIFAEEVVGFYQLLRAILNAKTKLADRDTSLTELRVDGQLQVVGDNDGVILRFVSNV